MVDVRRVVRGVLFVAVVLATAEYLGACAVVLRLESAVCAPGVSDTDCKAWENFESGHEAGIFKETQ